MSTSIRETSIGKNNLPGIGAIAAGLVVVGTLVGVAIWQATDTAPRADTTFVPPASVPAVEAQQQRTLVYLVNSQAQGEEIVRADMETQLSIQADGGSLDHTVYYIDVSTPEGQREAYMLQAELSEVMAVDPHYDPSAFQVFDLTAGPGPAAVPAPSSSAGAVTASDSWQNSIPTYFFIVDSKEEGDRVLREDAQLQADMMIEDGGLHHHAVILDVSTPEGRNMLEAVNGDLHMIQSEVGGAPLLQVFDVRE